MYTVSVSSNRYDGSDYDYFNSLTEELEKHVNDGNFTTYLHENAVAMGNLPGLITASSSSVDVETTNPFSNDDNEQNDKDGDDDDDFSKLKKYFYI
jgi:hypothetical protein